ncbi:GlxA family transcriptional regulator [Brevibacterium atlanticum]|uniref:GlxA family transcriptional regulator n=1 Tax=Brevibacterium atlanticum TaxID=2697563 RepID=UPI00141DF543|nr:DJ-1/PfpI family protein [Brevibacterium atlanticum]
MTQNPQSETPRHLRVGFVVFDGMTMLDVTGPAEVFRYARQEGLNIEMPLIAQREGDVRTASGFALSGAQRPEQVGPLDIAIVAGGDELPHSYPDGLLAAAESAACQAGQVASVCTGAFVLAELGLLDRRRATTHWRHAGTLARRFPQIDVSPHAIFVRDGNCLTSAGVSAGIDLALAIVEDVIGAASTREIARELVVFMQRPGSQSQFSAGLESITPRDSLLHEAMTEVAADPALEHTAASMAERASLSPRHLARQFWREVGTTPHRWLQSVRLQRAQNLLLDGRGVLEAAAFSGLGSDDTLRRVLMRESGLTPREYVRRFSTTKSA